MLRLLPFFLIWLTFSAHAVVDGQDIILASGAEQKLIREHSVRLYYKVNGQDLTFCSGVVLDPQTIATAGHCFAADDDEVFQNAVDHGQIFAQLSTDDPQHRTRDVQIDVRGHEFSDKRDHRDRTRAWSAADSRIHSAELLGLRCKIPLLRKWFWNYGHGQSRRRCGSCHLSSYAIG